MSSSETSPPSLKIPKKKAFQGNFQLQGDLHITLHALLIGSFAEGQTRIAGLTESGPAFELLTYLQSCNVSIEKVEDHWVIQGDSNQKKFESSESVYCIPNETALFAMGALLCASESQNLLQIKDSLISKDSLKQFQKIFSIKKSEKDKSSTYEGELWQNSFLKA